MPKQHQIWLDTYQTHAYVQLIDGKRAKLYIPGKVDTVMFRAHNAWLLRQQVINEIRWDTTLLQYIYSKVEQVLDHELHLLVNEVMFDEGVGS